MDEANTVIISEAEYKALQRRSKWLWRLEAAGVDNWEGIDYAKELRRERAKEDEEEDD